MSAKEKNAQALKALFKSETLANRLLSTRIAVVTHQDRAPASAVLLASVLVDTLARIWPNIDFYGADSTKHQEEALQAAASGGSPLDGLHMQWNPPYDCVIAIGCDAPSVGAEHIRVAAKGWTAYFGSDSVCNEDRNPVGPAFAAALAAAQVFQVVFSNELADSNPTEIRKMTFDVKEICGLESLDVKPLDLGSTTVFGTGAVTHGLAWLLEHWPQSVSGTLNLVDQDRYGQSNGQRYAFMSPADVGQLKSDSIKSRLSAAHQSLNVSGYAKDLNSYCGERGYEKRLGRIIAGLDSAESRRHAALKLPENSINMWTAGVRIGAGRYIADGNGACLGCEYLEDMSVQDEVAVLAQQTGIQPVRIRDLLDTSRGLLLDEARQLSARMNVQAESLVGEPLRSVLPRLCATGHVQLPNSHETVDVPFAFASLLAGVAGFMMLLKDVLHPRDSSEGWTQHIFKLPTKHMREHRYRKVHCACCSELSAFPKLFFDERPKEATCSSLE
jgi:hypothetical protein